MNTDTADTGSIPVVRAREFSPADVPQSPPALLEGKSARHYAEIVQLCAIPIALAAVVMIVSALTMSASVLGSGLALGAVVVVIVAGIGVAYAAIRFSKAHQRERAAGYTTVGGAVRRGLDLWEIDPQTGDVIRMPGDRDLTRRENAALLATGLPRYTDDQLNSLRRRRSS